MEENGSLTEMKSAIKSGCLVFTTEHFSLYFVVGDCLEEEQPISDCLDYSYEILDSGTVKITNYFGNDTFIRVPDTYNGYPITHIGEYCFSNKNIEKIVIHNSMKHIESFVFNGCNNLSTIYYLGSDSEWNEINIDSTNDFSKFNIVFDVSIVNGILKIPENVVKDTMDDNIITDAEQPKLFIKYCVIVLMVVLIVTGIMVWIVVKKKRT